jgi:Amt family ammonium transporter
MVWGGGMLGTSGVLDYAGGTVVHINAGIAALVLCLVLGKRTGWKMDAKGFEPNSLALALTGACLLWVGWFGFNAGSALAADGRAGLAMSATHIATASAALFWMAAEWAIKGKPTTLGAITGAVGGLVAVTPAAGFIDASGGLMIGAVSGVGCFFASTWLKAKLGYDDSLDVVGVHGAGGIIGSLLTGVFAIKAIGGTSGLLEGNSAQMLIQAKGVVVTLLWSGIGTFIIAKAIDLLMGLRVSAAQEKQGLDIAMHGEVQQ